MLGQDFRKSQNLVSSFSVGPYKNGSSNILAIAPSSVHLLNYEIGM
jgi:hypothetical protein